MSLTLVGNESSPVLPAGQDLKISPFQGWSAQLGDAATIALDGGRMLAETNNAPAGVVLLTEAADAISTLRPEPVTVVEFAAHAVNSLTAHALGRIAAGERRSKLDITAQIVRPHVALGRRAVEAALNQDTPIGLPAIELFVTAAIAENILYGGTNRGGADLRRAREAISHAVGHDSNVIRTMPFANGQIIGVSGVLRTLATNPAQVRGGSNIVEAARAARGYVTDYSAIIQRHKQAHPVRS